jgi:hypothetical protein
VKAAASQLSLLIREIKEHGKSNATRLGLRVTVVSIPGVYVMVMVSGEVAANDMSNVYHG